MLIRLKRTVVFLIALLLLTSCSGGGGGAPGIATVDTNDETVTVRFNSQGGSYVASQTLSEGSLVSRPSAPVRSGFVFAGWYREAACTTIWNFDSDTPENDLTLYAKWTDGAASGLSGFSVINSYSVASGLNILYNKSFSGTVSYKMSRKYFDVTDAAGFDTITSIDGQGSKTITADELTYDDYIYTGSIMTGTSFYIYLLNQSTGEVRTLTHATDTNPGYTSKTDTSTSGDSTISYTIYYPYGYDPSASKTWPLVLSIKGPSLVTGNNQFPCVVFKTDVSGTAGVMQNDVNNIRQTLKAFIENSTNRIDKNRLYTIGFSAGGCAALMIANDDGSSQYNFKAVVGVGVSSWLGNSSYSSNLDNVHVWLYAGENDTTWGPQTVSAYNGIVANTPGRTADLLLTEMPGVAHDSNPVWASPYMYMWLLSK